jgi:hypothetical protein
MKETNFILKINESSQCKDNKTHDFYWERIQGLYICKNCKKTYLRGGYYNNRCPD